MLAPLADEALWLLDKNKMTQVAQEAARVAFLSDAVSEIHSLLSEIHSLLSLPEDKLVELQLKKAVMPKDTTHPHPLTPTLILTSHLSPITNHPH